MSRSETERCSSCDQIPDAGPLHQCKNRHPFCTQCFEKIQDDYRGEIADGGCCAVCQYSGKFEAISIASDFMRKKPARREKGRAPRYDIREVLAAAKSMEESLMQKSFGDGLTNKSLGSASATTLDEKLFTCLHDGCSKSVPTSSLITHFKENHPDVPYFKVEGRQEFKTIFDVGVMKYDRNFCLAMLTLYESNKINVDNSKCPPSVINTCNMFSMAVPKNTFWIMMSTSPDFGEGNSFVVFWIYTNSEDRYQCSIELSSGSGKHDISSFCYSIGLQECYSSAVEVARSMKCLFAYRGSFVGLLAEGDNIDLKIKLQQV